MEFNKSLFLLTLACFSCSELIGASPIPLPTRRAFDTSNNANNVNLNRLTELQHLQDVDATIKEVEELLKSDLTLPRLTRGEILDIIENLTRSDVQKEVARDPKAIMVVLPYSADSVQNGDVQALYTKPPMTHFVDDRTNEDKLLSKPEIPQKRRGPTKKPFQANYDNNQGVKIAKVPSFVDSVNDSSKVMSFSEHFQQQQTDVTEKTRTTTENPFTRFINKRRKTTKLPGNHKQESQDVFFSTTTTTTTTTTEASRTTQRSKVNRKPTLTSTITTAKSTALVPNQGINLMDPPASHHVLLRTTTTFLPSTKIPSRLSTTQPTIPAIFQKPIIVDDVQIPDDFKDVLKSLDILIKQAPTERAPTVNVQNTQTDQLSDEDKLKLLFASLGGSTTTTSTSTTTAEPDVMQVANNLTPEMKDLLMTFGLIPDPNKDKTTTPKVEMFMEPSSVIDPDSYSSFKPLPAASNNNPNEDMEDFLATFGLVDTNKPAASGNREQKAILMSRPQNKLKPTIPNMDMIPDEFKDIIADIKIPVKINLENPASDSQIKSNKEKDKQPEKEYATKKPDHVFKPTESGTEYVTEDEINRLNQLMNLIKQFENLNGTASEEDLKHIDLENLKDLVNSFNVPLDQQDGPNPLDYDVSPQKNEFKRQTSTTEKSARPINPSLALLEESFGSPAALSTSSDSVSETVQIETTTTEAPKRTGFYYLLDWNSFFDIDNQKGKRVNLRFQPKAGDPKRFFSVNVP